MKFIMFDHASAMYVDRSATLGNEPVKFDSANDAMKAGMKVLEANGWKASDKLEIMQSD